MNKVIRKWSNKPFIKNVLTLTTGATIAQAIPALIAPVLTRLYRPEEFGLLALFISISSLLSIIVTGKYELAIILPQKEKGARNLVRLSLRLTIIISLFYLLIILLFHNRILHLLHNEKLSPWLYFVPLSVLLSATYEVYKHYCIRKKAYRNISESSIMRTGTASLVQISFGFLNIGAAGLIIGYILSLFSGNLKVWKIFRNKKEKENTEYANTELKAVGNRYRNFPLFTMPSLFLNSASVQLPIFVLSTFFSNTVVGFYALAQRILRAPMTVIGTAIGQVYFQKAAECKTDKLQLKSLTWKLYKSLLWMGVLPLGILLCFGTEIFSFVFGKEWAVAGDYGKVLSVWFFMVFISSPISNLFFVQEKQKEGLYFQILLFLSRLLVLSACVLLHFNAYKTVLYFGIIGALLFFIFIFYLLSLVGIKKWLVLIYTIMALTVGILPFFLIKTLLWM